MAVREPSRRALLTAAGGSCAAAATGCVGYATGRAAPTTVAPAPPALVQSGAGPLGPTSDIPVGSGKVFAFSATCTHQGCTVSSIADNTINCPCHGSQFNLADGSVVKRPAKAGRPAKKITVSGGQISLT